MSRRARIALFLGAALVLAGCFAAACTHLPPFGTDHHPYGDRALLASLKQQTANAVASVTFDQRGFDTLGEEFLLFASVVGATVLLRRARDEHARPARPQRVLPSTRLFGALLLPVVLLCGGYVVAHGHLTPGGGFQGGVILATGLHLAYVAADYRALRRVRPLAFLDAADAVAAGAFAALGLAGLLASGAYLENVLPLGSLRDMASAGLVPVLNVAVGMEVASAIVVLLAQFLEQDVELEREGGEKAREGAEGRQGGERA
ncbi:MnhB domain-containing protein [Streptomyces sp. SDT5-1]|uniref:MnhB domain-containing protein n=1 Tax=Streptomyces sp. SDT5-1 TaxID=3406418 RepID=UPI003FD61BCB